jgi:hypothetical protein
MTDHQRRSTLKKVLVLIAASGLAMTASLHPAHAQWGNCLDDPQVYLSGGGVADLGLHITTDASSVTGASTYYANFYFSTTAGVTGTGSLAFNGATPTAAESASGFANTWFTTYYSGQPRQ